MAGRITPNGIAGIVGQTPGFRPVVQVIGMTAKPLSASSHAILLAMLPMKARPLPNSRR